MDFPILFFELTITTDRIRNTAIISPFIIRYFRPLQSHVNALPDAIDGFHASREQSLK